ncbi:MAG: ABC transporter substrate-binding protein [Bacteroidetes bacterium]|jgi:ABC-type nitrate/sulfonate/bicarbonate transport system substrate-binding protein|nr:ABC transporter substrate-binding protein [Bacteroidota bacterium]
MLKINIGGVPEHFNYPWLKCIESNAFQEVAQVNWKDCPGGTGEMATALEEQKIDLAMMLTEGSIKEIESGKRFKIIQKYIETPLLWGVHVDAESSYETFNDIQEKKAAISRINSGSHLMTYVLAKNNSWNFESLNFKVCKNLDGAINALHKKSADFLLWERYTTKPYVDNGDLKYLGNCPTPWPCFVIVSREDFYNKNTQEILQILDIINSETSKLKNDPNLPSVLSERYQIKLEDARDWLSSTEWSQQQLKTENFRDYKALLKNFGILG